MQAEVAKAQQIDPQLLNDCAVNARTVAHNLELEVVEGKPGEGSYLISGEGRFVLDPEHCKTREEAIWTACHEGMHEWQTPGFNTLPLTESDRKTLESAIGLASLRNIVEDCAGNDGMVRSHPGLAAPTINVYQKQLERAGGILTHPEIINVAQQIGREPKFAKALSSILDAWAKFRVDSEDFDLKLSPSNGFKLPRSGDREVDQVLKEALHPTSVVINQTLISGQEEKIQVRDIGVRRFLLMKEYLLPLIERLVKLDIQEELQNQAAQKAQAEGKLSDKTYKEISEQQAKRSAEKQDSQGESQPKQGESNSPSEGKGDGKNDDNKGSPQSQGSSSGEDLSGTPSDAMGKPSGNASSSDSSRKKGAKKGALEESGKNKDPGSNPVADSKLSNKESFETNSKPSKGEEKDNTKPIDTSKLSDSARKEIADYLNALPQEERDKLAEKARKLLQDLDDAIATLLKPKNTADDSVPTHEKQREIKEAGIQAQQSAKRFGAFSQAIRDASLRAAEPYQRIFMEIAPQIELIEEQVRHLFIPEDDFQWRGAFPSGQKLNKHGPMRFEADPSQYVHLFDRRSQPASFSYEFDLIVDRSGSMGIEQKFEETKKVAVFLIELLSRFDIPCSVRVFDNSVQTVKKWEDDATDPAVQKVIAESFLASGGTNDALAIATAYREAAEREEKHKFILVLSDAESGVGESLRAILEKVQAEGSLVLFHFGIGPNTADLHGFYPHSRGNLPVKGEGGFFDVFTEVLGDLILNPDLYKGKKNETA